MLFVFSACRNPFCFDHIQVVSSSDEVFRSLSFVVVDLSTLRICGSCGGLEAAAAAVALRRLCVGVSVFYVAFVAAVLVSGVFTGVGARFRSALYTRRELTSRRDESF